MTTYDRILVEREDRLTIITINRPHVHNALDPETQKQLQHAFDCFEKDDEQWIAILTGAGSKAFCAGMDLKAHAASEDIYLPEGGLGGIASRFSLNKPLIAAVNGVAMGGGFELALACDLVVAAQSAIFALPEPRVGLAALAGGIQKLPQQIGLKAAMGILLTGRRVSAREGIELGFVNEIADGDVMEAARRLAGDVLACSPMAIRATKQAVMHSFALPASQSMSDAWDCSAVKAMLASEDAKEGPKAFAGKRLPSWQGC